MSFANLENDSDSSVESVEMALDENRKNRIPLHAGHHGLAHLDRAVVKLEQSVEGLRPDHAALVHGRQDGHLVVVGLAEAPAVVQVDGVGVVAKDLEGLVVVAVHVAHEEVVDGHVHQVEQPAAVVVGLGFPDDLAVILVRLPVGLSTFVIRSSPRVSPSFASGECLKRAFPNHESSNERSMLKGCM